MAVQLDRCNTSEPEAESNKVVQPAAMRFHTVIIPNVQRSVHDSDVLGLEGGHVDVLLCDDAAGDAGLQHAIEEVVEPHMLCHATPPTTLLQADCQRGYHRSCAQATPMGPPMHSIQGFVGGNVLETTTALTTATKDALKDTPSSR